MKVVINKIIPFDDMPTDQAHFHVLFAEEAVKYHRTCEVVVFIDKNDSRPMPELKDEAVRRAYDFLAEVVARRGAPPDRLAADPPGTHRRQ